MAVLQCAATRTVMVIASMVDSGSDGASIIGLRQAVDSRRHDVFGFSMIEVLVSIVIMTIGLLGFAGLFVRSQQAGIEAYDRAQALLLVESMVNRISTNRQTASCYALTPSSGEPYLGVAAAMAMPYRRHGSMRISLNGTPNCRVPRNGRAAAMPAEH